MHHLQTLETIGFAEISHNIIYNNLINDILNISALREPLYSTNLCGKSVNYFLFCLYYKMYLTSCLGFCSGAFCLCGISLNL